MKCKHKNKTVRCWSKFAEPPQWYHSFKPLPGAVCRRRYYDALVCDDCGAWQSLGPARDTEQTAIEVRGTSLAHGVGNEADFTACEWMGWNGDEVYSSGGSYHTIDKLPLRNLREWHAGYLAMCIVEHEEAP